ncbi:hypothetical protein ACF1BS_04370 [Streptomyces sp. NPDC014748]|uniref:hypothetical protein n=1 Tax=Streptomyces sp. NPDC014748 TaxID=3364905 RepID=UPI003701B96F
MPALLNRRITIADYLVQRGLPADWRYGSPLGRVTAQLYRQTYHREPSRAWRLINGRFRRVMAYTPDEQHVLAEAWETYDRTATPPATTAPDTVLRRIDRDLTDYWAGSGDSMRWRPTGSEPLRSHP